MFLHFFGLGIFVSFRIATIHSGKWPFSSQVVSCSRKVCARSLAAYQDFLALWKDADPDIPILNEAKTEYAKVQ